MERQHRLASHIVPVKKLYFVFIIIPSFFFLEEKKTHDLFTNTRKTFSSRFRFCSRYFDECIIYTALCIPPKRWRLQRLLSRSQWWWWLDEVFVRRWKRKDAGFSFFLYCRDCSWFWLLLLLWLDLKSVWEFEVELKEEMFK